jgi:hypothetical protein
MLVQLSNLQPTHHVDWTIPPPLHKIIITTKKGEKTWFMTVKLYANLSFKSVVP